MCAAFPAALWPTLCFTSALGAERSKILLEVRNNGKEEIIENCKKNISKYGVPKEIEFRDALPKTLVGKVAYRQLEEEEAAKYEQAKTE